ncbi:hypothetical protein ASPSYDRAFT_50850 [Aspergillus sydowii CBS 593.65]|uniref:Uncharacterized protein n=1 Tax=Aspergillus sydowii CBS 593.65 TaxID=1036612 RepID=A0A1L9T1M6_9EURO|nr:uncharacterized protein ASPSYDRAFT_50850 [Aspergillus sydowii CBS 593.65]OJJ53350.1 hypothetical protein ASPSYDRAFT_50850 [Aspergillus sydowii CBS 593.65]
MGWSIEDIVSFITMCISIPTFMLALWAILKCCKRSRHRRQEMSSRSESPTAIDMPLNQISHKAFPSLPSLAIGDPGVLEAGWVQFNQITTSTMSRSGTFRVDQRIRED